MPEPSTHYPQAISKTVSFSIYRNNTEHNEQGQLKDPAMVASPAVFLASADSITCRETAGP